MTKQKAWLGIDPGQTGAAALIPAEGLHLVEDWPKDVNLAAELLRSWSMVYDIELAGMERVAARPGQGVTSMFRFGQNLGQWEGIIATLGIPLLQPTPREWQAGLVRKSDGSCPKTRSLAAARRLFPRVECDLTKKAHSGRSDALLIAWWARQHA